jgi:hypothetical protein
MKEDEYKIVMRRWVNKRNGREKKMTKTTRKIENNMKKNKKEVGVER